MRRELLMTLMVVGDLLRGLEVNSWVRTGDGRMNSQFRGLFG